MVFPRLQIPWRMIAKVFGSAAAVFFFLLLLGGVYLVGVLQGYKVGQADTEGRIAGIIEQLSLLSALPSSSGELLTPTQIPTPKKTTPQSISWGGPELWQAVNKRRTEFGVNPLQRQNK